jgi:hypothetical protein
MGEVPPFDVADADEELMASLRDAGVDLEDEGTLELLRAYTEDPNALNKWRAGSCAPLSAVVVGAEPVRRTPH